MRDGRAWAAWASLAGGAAGDHLTQLRYETAALTDEGSVELWGRVQQVFDGDTVTVATLEHGVVVLSPACR